MPVCPRCRAQPVPLDVPLLMGFGALLEDVCPACNGRFLGAAAVERVVIEELGLSAELLREMTALFMSKARLACPSCASQLSPLELRKVRIDLCTGCGGAWLDAGELTLLGAGRHVELSASRASASSAPVPAVAAVAPVPEAGHFLVFFTDPTGVGRDALMAAFAQVPGLASADAGQIVARHRCTAIEGVSEPRARHAVEALAAEGIDARVADESWLSLPPAFPTNALAVDAGGLVLGRAADASGRVEAPWSTVAAIAAGQIVRSSMKRTVSARQSNERGGGDTEFDLAIVEAADVCLDIVLRTPPRRYRLLLSTMLFGEGGARPRQEQLQQRFAELVRHAPAPLTLGRGVRGPLPRYRSMKDLERELGWLLWRTQP